MGGSILRPRTAPVDGGLSGPHNEGTPAWWTDQGGETRFACVDGPEFDGHEVNWDLLIERQRIYLEEEARAAALYDAQCRSCRGGGR